MFFYLDQRCAAGLVRSRLCVSPQTKSTPPPQPEKSHSPPARSHPAHPPPDAAKMHAIHTPAPHRLQAQADIEVPIRIDATTQPPAPASPHPAQAVPPLLPIPNLWEQTAPPTQTPAQPRPLSTPMAPNQCPRFLAAEESKTLQPPTTRSPPPPQQTGPFEAK